MYRNEHSRIFFSDVSGPVWPRGAAPQTAVSSASTSSASPSVQTPHSETGSLNSRPVTWEKSVQMWFRKCLTDNCKKSTPYRKMKTLMRQMSVLWTGWSCCPSDLHLFFSADVPSHHPQLDVSDPDGSFSWCGFSWWYIFSQSERHILVVVWNST